MIKLDTRSGRRTVQGYQLYDTNSDPATFGKGAGLGDIEIVCSRPQIQIGDYVWFDENKNGVHDSDESGIDEVTVELYREDQLIASTITSDGGQWHFCTASTSTEATWVGTGIDTSINSNVEYVVRLSGTQDQLADLQVTLTDVEDNSLDGIDNDAVENGENIELTVIVEEAGCADHSLAFGLIPGQCFETNIEITVTKEDVCIGEENGQAILGVSGGATPYTYEWSDEITAESDGDTLRVSDLNAGAYTVTVTDTDGCTATTDFTINTINCNPAPTCTGEAAPGEEVVIDCSILAAQSLAGVAFNDINVNGVKDNETEAGLAGVIVNLYDSNESNLVPIATATTDSDGEYLFENLELDNYRFCLLYTSPSPRDRG